VGWVLRGKLGDLGEVEAVSGGLEQPLVLVGGDHFQHGASAVGLGWAAHDFSGQPGQEAVAEDVGEFDQHTELRQISGGDAVEQPFVNQLTIHTHESGELAPRQIQSFHGPDGFPVSCEDLVTPRHAAEFISGGLSGLSPIGMERDSPPTLVGLRGYRWAWR